MPTTLSSDSLLMKKMRDHPVEVEEVAEVEEEPLRVPDKVAEDKTQSKLLRRPRMISQLYEHDDLPSDQSRELAGFIIMPRWNPEAIEY